LDVGESGRLLLEKERVKRIIGLGYVELFMRVDVVLV